MERKTSSDRHIGPLMPEDLADLMEIENSSFIDPWPTESFEGELSNRSLSKLVGLWVGGKLAAFACFWLVTDEIHLLNIATHPDYRRQGLAWDLLHEVMRQGLVAGMSTIYLEVRVSNHGAQKLYQKAGFRQVGRRRRYYSNGEDALVLERKI